MKPGGGSPCDGRPFRLDRFGHAIDVYACLHGREGSTSDIGEWLEKDVALSPGDHILGRLTDRGILIVGIVSEGCTIVDTSDGPPTWASTQLALRGNLAYRSARSHSRYARRRRALVAKLEALDILEAPQ
jgi:hypothetical protein